MINLNSHVTRKLALEIHFGLTSKTGLLAGKSEAPRGFRFWNQYTL